MSKRPNKCITKFCRGNVKRKGKCSKCQMREWRVRYPDRAAYSKKKWHARQKGIEFTITFSEFLAVWKQGGVIDRINSLRGYHVDNIQALSSYENSVKGATIDKVAHSTAPF